MKTATLPTVSQTQWAELCLSLIRRLTRAKVGDGAIATALNKADNWDNRYIELCLLADDNNL